MKNITEMTREQIEDICHLEDILIVPSFTRDEAVSVKKTDKSPLWCAADCSVCVANNDGYDLSWEEIYYREPDMQKKYLVFCPRCDRPIRGTALVFDNISEPGTAKMLLVTN